MTGRIFQRLARRTITAKAALQAARHYLRELDGEERETLQRMVSASGEGTPPSREPTSWGFQLTDSRALKSLRLIALCGNKAETADIVPSTPPKSKYSHARNPPPYCYAKLYRPAAGCELRRQLDPRNLADTFTGQGFKRGEGLEYLAERATAAYAESPHPLKLEAAQAAAQAAEDRRNARKPRSKSANTKRAASTAQDLPYDGPRHMHFHRELPLALARVKRCAEAAERWRQDLREAATESERLECREGLTAALARLENARLDFEGLPHSLAAD